MSSIDLSTLPQEAGTVTLTAWRADGAIYGLRRTGTRVWLYELHGSLGDGDAVWRLVQNEDPVLQAKILSDDGISMAGAKPERGAA